MTNSVLSANYKTTSDDKCDNCFFEVLLERETAKLDINRTLAHHHQKVLVNCSLK